MFPNFGKMVAVTEIKNRGGLLKAPMQKLPWGDLVLLEKAFLMFKSGQRNHELHLPGEIFRPNKTLTRRSEGTSTHIIYADAYEAVRGATHAVRNYGLRGKQKGTEASDLKTDVQTLREYVVFLLRMGPHFEHVLRDLYLGMGSLAERYGWKIDESKKKATAQMIRGLIEKDSLGRQNIPAAAMSMGGAIWNLLEREEAMQWLSMHMDQRAIQTERLIASHMDLYKDLWIIVGKDSSTEVLLCNSPARTEPARANLARIFEQMESIRLLPFAKNARHTSRDIERVLHALSRPGGEDQEIKEKKKLIRRLKEGARWVFVLDSLQREIIFPLSYLIDDLLRENRVKHRAKGKQKKRVPITTSMAPEKFADFEERIRQFGQKLGKCDDSVLAHPVKNEILALLDVAEAHRIMDDWRYVKQDLVAISQIL